MFFSVFLLISCIKQEIFEKQIPVKYDLDVKLEYPRIMWSFYDRKMQKPIQEMLDKTLETVKDKWTFNFLTYENLSNFLDVSTFPSNLRNTLPAHQSDYIRLRLLEKYGGWWIDTALIINSNDIMEDFYSEAVTKHSHLVAVCNVQCPRKLIEDGFMYAPKGSIVIKEWLKELEKAHVMGQQNYIYSLYRSGVTFPFYIFEPNYPIARPYMTTYAAQQKTLDQIVPRNTTILIHRPEVSLYQLNYECHKNAYCVRRVYFNKEKLKKYPIVKLNSWVREIVFRSDDTVTCYDSFIEPNPLKKGMDYPKDRIKRSVFYHFISNISMDLLVVIVFNILKNYLVGYQNENKLISK